MSFSGGKDSLVALDLAYRVGVRKAVFSDTTIEFEETREYVDRIAQLYGIRLDVVRAPQDFFSLIELVTAPSRRQRWCCDVLKFGPISLWGAQEHITSFITGLRRAESPDREGYEQIDLNPMVPIRELNPIIDWTDGDVWKYIRSYGLPSNPLYKHLSRIGCWCCPFKPSSEWKTLERLYPEKMEYLSTRINDLADRLGVRDKRTFVQERGWTYWIYPTRRVNIGVSTLCHGSDGGDIVLSSDDEDHIRRIAHMLPILTPRFRVIGNRIRITLKDASRKQLQILVERALNCVGCGACLSICACGALALEDGRIVVDSARCNHCLRCMNASTLKGSCIARHYMPRHAALVEL